MSEERRAIGKHGTGWFENRRTEPRAVCDELKGNPVSSVSRHGHQLRAETVKMRDGHDGIVRLGHAGAS